MGVLGGLGGYMSTRRMLQFNSADMTYTLGTSVVLLDGSLKCSIFLPKCRLYFLNLTHCLKHFQKGFSHTWIVINKIQLSGGNITMFSMCTS